MSCNKLPACHVSTFTSCVVSDSEDVRRGDERVRPVLAPLPRLLHHHPLPPRHHEGLVTIIITIITIIDHYQVHPAHVPRLLLVCDGQLLHQPHSVLRYEQEVGGGIDVVDTIDCRIDSIGRGSSRYIEVGPYAHDS